MTRTPISIRRDAKQPLYEQLRDALGHQIANGALDPRLPLPSSRELASELGVSRNTVNTAYQELLAAGFIEARPRRGFFVNAEIAVPLEPPGDRERGAAVDWSEHIVRRVDSGMPEIAKVRDWQRYPYPFIAGQVATDSFPRLAWSRALRDALEKPHLHFSLRDGVDEDDPMLVEALCKHVLPSRGIEVEPDNVLITLGSQQGLDLLAHSLLGPDRTVGVENPGYLDAWHIFVRAGAAFAPIDVDDSGLIPPADLDGVDLVYLTPSHHSPTNVTLSIGRRHALLSMAERSRSLIIEDDYDSEFRYQGSPTPALKALPGSQRVVYLGTFSKFLAPGLRLGYMVAEPDLIAEVRNQRRYRVRHAAGQTQRAMALLIESGQYRRTIRRRRTDLQRKWTRLRDMLREQLDWAVNPPPGGVSIWLTGPPDLDGVELAERCLEAGVVIERGDIFFADPQANRYHVRLGFSAIDLEAIAPGVRQFAQVLSRM
ncbi:MocR-like pyridoxine biosynthesis transcription factor PdxR [Solicola gregarius]|uniref:PLP-dependent aminotransferase family protein n=1 Tax=Solicola gregarius TaxID=2908642 RepID=A0AA46YJA6_9ACTN|nr:PLP-dependent aminotransferase family protein [Solicola gregarius]UYM03329.1 PLP-dependent aminotransferase family protein [Solicola gregarius]